MIDHSKRAGRLAATLCLLHFDHQITLYIGLYRKNAIAIESEAKDPFGGKVYYVTMQIRLHIPEFARKERLHCDVVHITTKWVFRLILDRANVAIQTSPMQISALSI